jgi:hypothetical protein
MSRNQIERLADFPGKKKSAERLYGLYQAGHINRAPFFQPKQGRAEFVYFRGRCPAPHLLRHTIMVAELRVQTARSFPPDREFVADFFYGHELTITSGLMPDAALVVRRAEKTALVVFEADNSTERLSSPSAYSVIGKLRSYAGYYDSEQYQKDFLWVGSLRGFRVGVVLQSHARLANLQRLVSAEGFDFVMLTTMDDITKHGMHAAIWRLYDGSSVDILGRHHG